MIVPLERPVRSTISASDRSRKYRMMTAPRCDGESCNSASRTALRSSFRTAAAPGSAETSGLRVASVCCKVVVRSRRWTALMASLTTILKNQGPNGRFVSYCSARSKTRRNAPLTTSSAWARSCVTRYAARSAFVWYRDTSVPRAAMSPCLRGCLKSGGTC